MSTRTFGRLAATMGLVLAGLLSGACTGSELETRTFRLRSLRADEAEALILPYVYQGREGAPGTISRSQNAITVRELPENLERIQAVLEEFDRGRVPLRLRFHLIYADGDTGTDPEIAEISEALRGVLRYQGYRLAGTSLLQVHGGSYSQQEIGSPDGDRYDRYTLEVRVQDVWGPPDSLTVHMSVQMHDNDPRSQILATDVSAPVGETVVIGTAQSSHGEEGRAVILAVTPELASGG